MRTNQGLRPWGRGGRTDPLLLQNFHLYMKSLPPVIHKHEKKKKKKKDSKQLSVKRIKKLTHSYSKKKIKEPATVIKAARSSLTHQSIFIFFIFYPDTSKSKKLLTFLLVSNFHVHNTFLPFIFYFIYLHNKKHNNWVSNFYLFIFGLIFDILIYLLVNN